MQISEYRNIFENEESHFFYVSNHKIILELLSRFLPKKRKLKILDAGCGTGLLAKKMSVFGDITGLDFSGEAIKFAKKRGVKVKKGSVTTLPFKGSTFDAVVSIDVLYHSSIKDDKKALAEFRRVLKPGGILILRLPANKWLHLKHDTHVHTRERYTKKEITERLVSCKFNMVSSSYVNAALLPLALLKQVIEFYEKTSRPSSGVEKVNPIINNTLKFILSLELPLITRGLLPFGLGIVAIAKK